MTEGARTCRDSNRAGAAPSAATGAGVVVPGHGIGSFAPLGGEAHGGTLAERAARLNTIDPTVDVLLAGARVMASDLDASEIHVGRALALDGGCGWAWQRRGWNCDFCGHVHEAMECFRTAVDLASPMQFLDCFGFASVCFEQDVTLLLLNGGNVA